MDSFFKALLLEESGIYTLWGTKPVTRCVLYYYTQEEIQDWLNGMTEEEKKTCFVEKDTHFEENWEKWEKIQEQFPMKTHFLCKRYDLGDNKAASVYFVNILETALILQRHYEVFKMIAKEDFNSFDMACDFPNEQSSFWKKVLNNSLSLGILFGFGEDNAWSFHWKHVDHDEKFKRFAEDMPFHPSDTPRYENTLADFTIPVFMTADKERDEMIKKYQKEREEIKKIYKGQNFLELTLQKLTSL